MYYDVNTLYVSVLSWFCFVAVSVMPPCANPTNKGMAANHMPPPTHTQKHIVK